MTEPSPVPPLSPLREIIQPFIDLVHAPRALWAINLSALLEGFVYFGMAGYLAMYFNQYGHLKDMHAGWMVGVLTSGITICMLFFGGRADQWGLRRTFIVALVLMFLGRSLLALAPGLGLASAGLLSPFNAVATAALLIIVLGYGMYYPAGYAAVRKFTTPATANMGFTMLYAVMNLGAWLPTFMAPIRRRYEIRGAYGFFTTVTLVGLVILFFMLSKKTVADATAAAAQARADAPQAPSEGATRNEGKGAPAPPGFFPGILHWLKHHPIADPKFAAFIFCLIPVQTLFAYNYFVMPQYVNRAFAGTWLGDRFEPAINLGPLLVFILCPIVATLTARAKVYTMMILGTAVMAAPTFFLALGPTVPGLFAYILLMTVGEAMWQPRFLQYAAEIAPEGRTGAYMGVAQFPWFLTKMIVPLYSGAALARWCPDPSVGPAHTRTMWLIFGSFAMLTTVFLFLAKGWLGKDFKTHSS